MLIDGTKSGHVILGSLGLLRGKDMDEVETVV